MLEDLILKTMLWKADSKVLLNLSKIPKWLQFNYHSDVEIPNLDVTTFILKQIEKYNERICVEDALTGRNYTYQDIIEKVIVL